MKISRTRQAISGLAISIAIAATLLCGGVLALAESQSAVSERPTPTVYHIPTLVASGGPSHPATATHAATVVVIPSSVPATTIKTPSSTPALVATPTATDTAQPASCRGKPGWQPYRIQSGDTLYEIAYRYGITLTSLMNANCLTNGTIYASTTIYVPAVTPRALPEPPPGTHVLSDPPPTGTQTGTDGACTNPDSVITSPRVGAVLSGVVKIIGTAQIPNFAYYTIEIRQEGTGEPYANMATGNQPVRQGLLTELDTAAFPNGEFWLRLVVVDTSSNYPERCAILVTLSH